MKSIKLSVALVISTLTTTVSAQFPYTVKLNPLTITGLNGIHSYAYAQHEGKWLIVGGRLDGLHARQPFNAFPATQNNTNLMVIDPVAKEFWTRPLSELPMPIKEQLQSTNMSFHQHGDTLYIIGGYAFSESANGHITFPSLTTIQVSSLINSIINNDSIIKTFLKHTTHQDFAVTGGHLSMINDTFLLVGGHRFDGRYNAMGNPSYTQTYTNQVRRFLIHNHDTSPQVSFLQPIANQIHLHRRDYNLIPRIKPNNKLGFTISSGVFQTTANLPYLYPVDIDNDTIQPITSFNQYLSNYHSAVANIYEASKQTQYSIFFGGMSQYYYQNDSLIKDELVPFVKTISVLKRTQDTTLEELLLPVQMEGLRGAGAEFIKNENLPHLHRYFVDIENTNQDTLRIGHILGGISSSTLNPFANNQTSNTTADANIYEVLIIKATNPTGVEKIKNAKSIKSIVYPNPADQKVTLKIDAPESGTLQLMWMDLAGSIIYKEQRDIAKGQSELLINLPLGAPKGYLSLVISLNHIYFTSHMIQRQ